VHVKIKNCERHKSATAPLILIGDALHNFIDGVIIVAAFFTSYKFGILVTLTVFAHEIPQELADFGVLISNGYSKKKALVFNLLSGITTYFGGLLAYFTLEAANKLTPYVLAFSAASFIYIALADLVPQMHRKTNLKDSLVQISLIFTGILIIYIIRKI
jgi:zinc and cadmium transporter